MSSTCEPVAQAGFSNRSWMFAQAPEKLRPGEPVGKTGGFGRRRSKTRIREVNLQIYTNAPAMLDYERSTMLGDFDLGSLRIVSVDGPRVSATAQLQRYREHGFFATLYRDNALAFMALEWQPEDPAIE